jgi:hypothetical protein
MVCLWNICVNTLHKGDSIFTNNDNNNNNIQATGPPPHFVLLKTSSIKFVFQSFVSYVNIIFGRDCTYTPEHGDFNGKPEGNRLGSRWGIILK